MNNLEKSIKHFNKLPVVEKKELEKQVAKFIVAQKIIDSMEPTELEKLLDQKIEDYFKNAEPRRKKESKSS